MSLVDIVGNALGGGVLGAAGAAFSRWHEAKLELAKLEINNKHHKPPAHPSGSTADPSRGS